MSVLIKGMEWDGLHHKALFFVKDGEPIVIVETAYSYDDRSVKVYPVEIKPVDPPDVLKNKSLWAITHGYD